MKPGQAFNQEIPFTIMGEWFPGLDPERYNPQTDFWHRGDETPLGTEMRLFGAATRWAFQRFLEGKKRDEIKVLGQAIFGLNSRFMDDCLLKAREIIDSQKELIPLEIGETEAKLQKTEKKINKLERKANKFEAAGRTDEASRLHHQAENLGRRRDKLQVKLAEYQEYQANGTLPKVIFGGRSLWRKVTRGQASREEWRAARRNRLYVRGDQSKGGNPNLRIDYDGGEFSLAVTLSHLSVKTGQIEYLRQGKIQTHDVMSHAPKVVGRLWIPPKFQADLWEVLLTGAPYTVELIRGRDGRFRAHISIFKAASDIRYDFTRGILGVDINPDGLALAAIDREGKPEPFPAGFDIDYPKALGKFPGDFQIEIRKSTIWLGVPELRYARGDRRDYLIGVLAQVAVNVATTLGRGLALEGLSFKKDHDTNRAFNRMSSNFPWSKIVEAITRQAAQKGVAVKFVNPAYTSAIGAHKYQRFLGGTVHEAAAFVIARRAEGRKERFTPAQRYRISELRTRLLRQADILSSAPPTEGNGRTQSGILKRLAGSLKEERLLRHNGSPPWRQRGRASPLGALVELRRYAWARPLLAGSGETPAGSI